MFRGRRRFVQRALLERMTPAHASPNHAPRRTRWIWDTHVVTPVSVHAVEVRSSSHRGLTGPVFTIDGTKALFLTVAGRRVPRATVLACEGGRSLAQLVSLKTVRASNRGRPTAVSG